MIGRLGKDVSLWSSRGAAMRACFTIACFGLALLMMAPGARADDLKAACAALQGRVLSFGDDSARLTSADYRPDGTGVTTAAPGAPPSTINLPAHCDVIGVMHERQGRFGQIYAIHFHMRLPAKWNGRFLFQGGGGSDGVVGDALGPVSSAGPVAAALGYAVVSQDSGHDNATNNDPAHNGVLAFGFDPKAREDYGHTSLKATADAAKALIKAYYGKAPRYSYFVGCSKGGQEGMTFAQLYPYEFNGIMASAPGFALPKAALAEAWDTQAIASVVAQDGHQVGVFDLNRAFSASDLDLVRTAILAACDGDDGLVDGMVNDFAHCTDSKVLPKLNAHLCDGAKVEGCLSTAQIAALTRIVGGPRTSDGRSLYAGWFWPSGIAGEAWRTWKMGSSDGHVPALNVVLGAGSLAAVFTTPPTALTDPQSMLNFQLGFNFDRDAGRIYTISDPFTHSAWADIASRSTDLSAFRAHGGRLIVAHGESDPVFSLKDTLDWYDGVNARNGGQAANFVRVFPVPGMCHCMGGQATDRYDLFSSLVAWVEAGRAPDAIIATAGPATPWPGRTRPLCAWPEVARYTGGDSEKASSFACKAG